MDLATQRRPYSFFLSFFAEDRDCRRCDNIRIATDPHQRARFRHDHDGKGSHRRFTPHKLHCLSFSLAAAAAVLCASAGSAYANCANDGSSTLTCTGTISGFELPGVIDGGIWATGYDTVNVNSITADITPADGVAGIEASGASANLSVTSDTGEYSILTTGTGGIGIQILNIDADGDVTLNQSGNVTSQDDEALQITTQGGDIDATINGNISSTTSSSILAAVRLITTKGSIDATINGDVSSGGKGIFAEATDTAPRIDLTVNGDVTTDNEGIRAQRATDLVLRTTGNVSSGHNAINLTSITDATVTLAGGTIRGSNGIYANQTAGTIDNYADLSGSSGNAVNLLSSNLTINNHSIITGNVRSSISNVAFNNLAGAIFDAGGVVLLGAGNALTNAGTLSPGGTGAVQTTALTGNLVQTGAGRFLVDIDEGGAGVDRVDVSGTADFSGTVAPNIINLTSATGSAVIATATALSSTASAIDMGGYDFSLSVNSDQLMLSWEKLRILNLLIGANANQESIAAYLDAANEAGPVAGLQVLIDSLMALGDTELLAALNQLLPEIYSDAQISTLYASLGFADKLLSCKVNGPGTASIIAEGQCLWAGASATFLNQDTTFSQLGFREQTGSFAAGVQVALDDNWRLGFGAGYQNTSLDTVTNATSEGNVGQAGVALKYNVGSVVVAGALTGGRAWYDTTRPVAFTGFSGTAESDSTIDFLNGGLRFAYVFGSPQLYFKPVLDAAATRLDLGGFTETGGGAANLTIASSKQTVYTIAPSLETGTEWWLSNGTLIRPFLRGGVTFYEGNDFALSAAFAGAPVGISPFTINTDMDDVMGVIGAGLDMITSEDTVLHLTYDGQFGESTRIQSVALKGSVRY